MMIDFSEISFITRNGQRRIYPWMRNLSLTGMNWRWPV